MSKDVYACLLGKWECLNSDPHALVWESDPQTWWKEQGQDLFKYDYVNIFYKDVEYRIHPSFIQIVNDSNPPF